METTFNGRDTQHQQYHHHLGLGLGMAGTTSPIEAAAPPMLGRRLQQSWNGDRVFFPASSGEQRTHADDRRLADLACHEMPFLHGIDVNREPGASSRSSGGEQERADEGSDDEDDSGARGGGSRKRLRLSRDQSALLEESFKEHSTLKPKQQKVVLARQLGLRPRQVEVWFQNRRARTKHKQTEVVCEALKRCCEMLTEENRRLKRELRALKLLAPPAPHLYMRASPPTTLAMCPTCERVAPSGKPAAAMDENRVSLGPVPVLPVFVGRPAQMS